MENKLSNNQFEEKITFSCPTELPELNVMTVENSARLWKVFHETYTVCTVPKQNRGGGDWSYRKQKHVVTTRGQLMLIEPGEVHQTTKAYGPCDLFYVLQIPHDVVEKIAKEMGLKSAPHFKNVDTFKISLTQAFIRFHRSLENKNATLLEKQSLFHLALSGLLRECCEENAKPLPDPPKSALLKARGFIESNPSEEIKLKQLAGIVDLSSCHLLRSFKKEFGLPPHEYQNCLRITRASEMLKKGVPVKDLDLGFTDQSHFIRHFKKQIGITPGQYARAMKPKII